MTLPDDLVELRGQLEQLRRELTERDDFLAFTAHELRNPMHVLTLQLTAARMVALAAGATDVVARITKAEATLARYVDRTTVLLDLTRLDARAYPLAPRHIDLTTVLSELADSLRSEAEYHGVVLDFSAPVACLAYTDPRAIEHIVANLLSNAFKHSQGSTVSLSLARVDDQQVAISVADNGRGIAPLDQKRIFAKFERVPGARGRPGFGLGLWIVRLLAEALGGGISVDSRVDAGATFTLHIPSTASILPK